MIFWPFLAMVVLVPIPLGSIYPWSSTLISAITGLLLLGWSIQAIFDPSQPAVGLKRCWPFIVPFALVALWICIQIAPWTPESWHHPLWKSAGDVLGQKLEGRITLDAHESATGLMRLLTYGGIFWLALQYGRDTKNARRMVVALAIAGTVYAIYGLAMELSGANLVLWYEKEFYVGSVTSVFHYKNSYATYAAMGLLCVLGLLMEAVAKQGGRDIGKVETRRRVFTWLAEEGWIPVLGVVALASALVLSNSRAGVLSGGIGVIVLLVLLRFSHMKHAPYIRSLATVSFAAIMGFFIIGGGTVWERVAHTELSRDHRFTIYEGTYRAISDSPLTGTGSGTFSEIFPFYQPEDLHLRAMRAHNTYLENALELGIPASILIALAIAVPALLCAVGIWNRRQDAIFPLIATSASITIALHALLDFTMQVPAVAVTFFALLGTGYAQAWSSRR
tara:strand:- start:3377 stop:4723 length:1347 start_codon:yes stop_codon:yes gene_type:complete